jgi:phosphate starvation-inducible membrane PsiE
MKIKELVSLDTSLSILGSCFVAFGNSYIANCLWALGNLFLIKRNYKNNDNSQAVLFVFFEIIALIGIINHWRGVY